MSKSTYGYQRRKYDSQIDWGQIGTDFGNAILDKEKEREAKRQEIEAQTRELVRTLDDAPMGEYKPANEFALQYSGDAQEYLLMINRSLKSGLLSPKEFTIMRENIKTDTSKLFDLAQEYQDEYSLAMKRLKDGDSQDLETYIMENMEGFANLTSSRAYIDPAKGTVAIGKVDEDGNMIKKPGAFGSINALRNRMKSKFDRFDISAYVAPEIEKMGTFIDSVKEYGKITEILDPTQREFLDPDAEKTINAYEKFEDDLISSAMANPYNVTSILTNTIGVNPETKERYKFTEDRDEFEEDPNAILLIDDGSGTLKPEFKDEQEKNVRQAIRAKMRNMIDQETKISPVSEPRASKWEMDINRGRGAADITIDRITSIFSGNDTQKKQAAEGIARWYNENRKGNDPRAVGGRIDESGFYLVDEEGNEIPRSFMGPSGEVMDITDFAMGFTGDDPLLKAALDKINANDYSFVPPTETIDFSVITKKVQDYDNKTIEIDGEKFLIPDLVRNSKNSESYAATINDMFRDNPSVKVKNIDKPWFSPDKIILDTPDGEVIIPYSDSPTEREVITRNVYEKYADPNKKRKPIKRSGDFSQFNTGVNSNKDGDFSQFNTKNEDDPIRKKQGQNLLNNEIKLLTTDGDVVETEKIKDGKGGFVIFEKDLPLNIQQKINDYLLSTRFPKQEEIDKIIKNG